MKFGYKENCAHCLVTALLFIFVYLFLSLIFFSIKAFEESFIFLASMLFEKKHTKS